jgi:sporulation integral membrane protein YlbJ
LKKILVILSFTFLLLLLFSHPAAAAEGCTLGLQLWYTSVLPSLLPFLILSNLLIQTGLFQYLNRIYAPILGKIYRISDEGCYAVLIGFLCGFPMGAKVIADLVQQKQISPEEGSYLLGFCNNVSPAFFLNYLCLKQLNYASVPWKLVAFFYSLPLIYGLLTRSFYSFEQNIWEKPFENKKKASSHRLDFPTLDACIMDGFTTITRLGGYIILFTILVKLFALLPLPNQLLTLISILLEISCGLQTLSVLPGLSPVWKTALMCGLAMFGGLCICAQTQSVLDQSPLSIRTWLIGRGVLTLLAVLLLRLLLPYGVPVLPGYC